MTDSPLVNKARTDLHSSIQVDGESDEFLATHPWIRHYEQGVPACLDIPDRSLVWLLDNAAQHHPDHTALIYYGAELTYARLSMLTKRFAIGLQKLGVQKGNRVAIALPNIPQYLIAFYGALRAGAVVVPTNPLYTAHELQHQLVDAGATILIMLDMYYPMLRTIRQETTLEHIIVTSPTDYFSPLLRVLYPLSQRGTKLPTPSLTAKEIQEDSTLHVMRTMLESRTKKGGIELFPLPDQAHGDDLAALQYTGGTTGLSKGAMLTHRNLLANAMQTWNWTPHQREGEGIMLCALPFFHAYGMTSAMNISILGASTMILLPRFKVKDVLHAIQRYHPTHFPGIPTMYIAIMREASKHPDLLQSIRCCISGGAPLPAQVQTDFEQMTNGKLVEGYGLSEASPVTHCNPLTDENRNGSIGLPMPNVEAGILDRQTGKLLPIGEVGEIVVKGPNIMRGYWNREEETRDIFVNDWMRTGDIGKMDADGFFYVVDRAKDLILASGFNVYPREIEETLYHHDAIAEAAVIGMPDSYRGETVAAFVVLKPGYEPSEKIREDIQNFCKQELTAYKRPKILEFRQSLPKSAVGKILRRELRPQVSSNV
jgi:long-chain acyl-CoA synthetase